MIQASGGTPVLVTRINREAGEAFHYYPQFLPGGREFLYLVRNNDPSKSGIAFGSLDRKPGEAGPAVIAAQTEYSARYDAATKRLLYIQGDRTLVARRLDRSPARLVGDLVVVAEGVLALPANGYAEFSFSRNGTLFFGRGEGAPTVRLGWRDRSGKSLEAMGEPFQSTGSFSLSPDGTRVAYAAGASSAQSDLWVMELARRLSTRISFNKGTNPRWSPDGRFVYYNNVSGIHRKSADGLGEEVLLASGGIYDVVNAVAPDGKALLFGSFDIMKLPLVAGSADMLHRPEPYLKTNHQEWRATFSTDSRWVAYSSNESGRFEVYIQGYPDKRGKWLVSASGGLIPAWRGDGKELYWTELDGTLMAAGIELTGDGVRVGRPQALFRLPINDPYPYFQPSRDGQRFLVYEPPSTAKQQHSMVVIQNWAARLGK